jgi:hypothetical protein
MPITSTLDYYGKPAWIALMILSFIVWWPIGLLTLAFLIGSGRMGCGYGRHGENRFASKMERMQWKMERMRERMGMGGGFGGGWHGPSSGNRAFDEYKADTIRRLEEEQREFREFLDRLKMSKDKAEFDDFMNERRNRQTPDHPAQN